MTVAELTAVPEQDSWIYSDGPNRVCSSFVINVYEIGGLFGSLDINSTEFTPRDIYQLDFFDKNYKKPSQCKDKDLTYCQIMGDYLLDVETDGYSTITPYEHMFEHCPSMPPKFERSPNC